MIKIKKAWYNDLFTVYDIYSSDLKKIRETTNGVLYDTDEEHPITIAKSRHLDYEETNIDCDPIEEHNDNIE